VISYRNLEGLGCLQYEGMQAIVHSELASKKTGAFMLNGMKTAMIAFAAGIPPSSTALKVVKILLPVIGSVIAWPTSYQQTYTTLTSILDKCEDLALAVIGYIAVNAARARVPDTSEVGTDQSSDDARSSIGIEDLRINQ